MTMHIASGQAAQLASCTLLDLNTHFAVRGPCAARERSVRGPSSDARPGPYALRAGANVNALNAQGWSPGTLHMISKTLFDTI